MGSFRRFLITLLLAGAITLPIVVVIDFFWKQKDGYADHLLKTFNNTPRDVLYLGDSTIKFTGDRDQDRRGIDDFFKQQSGLTVCTIASPGFSPLMYALYVRLLTITRTRPRLVVMPLNLRSFSESGARRPAATFPLKQIDIRYRVSGQFDWYQYIQYRFLGQEERQGVIWSKRSVQYGNLYPATNREIMDGMRIDENIDYAPERELFYGNRLPLGFRYHYMMEIKPDDQLVLKVGETIDFLKALGIPTLVYLTPINCRDGEHYVGTEFTDRVSRNIEVIKNAVRHHGATVIDLSTELPASYFVHKKNVFEHLNTDGRRFVGEHVAEAAKVLLSTGR